MGRRKKQEVEATENQENENLDENEAEDASAVEAEALAEEDSKEETSEKEAEEAAVVAVATEEAEEPKEPKPKRRRNTRRKNTTPEVAAVATSPSEDLEVLKKSIEESMNSIVKQWVLVKEITGSVVNSLEKLQKHFPESEGHTLEEIIRQTPQKPATFTKVAAVASFVAVLFSVLSLSLSQSVRQSILSDNNVNRITEFNSTPMQPILSPEIAMNPTIEKEKTRKFSIGRRRESQSVKK